MSKEIIVIKKEDVSGEIISEIQEVETTVTKLSRVEIIDIIADLTDSLALYEKLLVDVDATSVSITP